MSSARTYLEIRRRIRDQQLLALRRRLELRCRRRGQRPMWALALLPTWASIALMWLR